MREIRTSGSVGAPGGNARGDPAPEPRIADGGSPAPRDREYVIQLEPAAGLAAMAGIAHVRAPALVASPYRAPDLGRDMP